MNRAKIKRHLDALADLDADVNRALEIVRYPAPRIRAQGFETLLSIIVSQQISTAASAAIMKRVRLLLPTMEAGAVLGLADGALRAAGLSARKVDYVEELARAIIENHFDPDLLGAMDDQSAIAAISSLKGFGVWSAEIYLMFSLRRSDVFPAGDLALRVALQKLKGIDEPLSEKQARELAARWSPYRSAGSLLLWHYYHGAPT
ncbi:MAG: DNA-3-methyladenine glycosylase 2 family protein [Gammaproteobacteria bacterium]|nr:DNA-3-methyladenine glycosylase 2 family protein [Gammaproteobacteria bacterium]MDH3537502.1 DNA-3-methyladenine glycosylase 2 family protein [Gammaproteobacteria bacterium]